MEYSKADPEAKAPKGDFQQFPDQQESGDAKFALKKANLFYAGQFLLFAILCFIIIHVNNTWLKKVSKIDGTDKYSIGASFAYRVSFALLVWYGLHAIASIGNKNLVDSMQFMIHISWLSIHQVILIALIVGSLFLPETFITIYFKIAIFVASVFLLLQLISLMAMFFDINDKFLKDDNFSLPIILLILFSGGAITLFVLAFVYFKCDMAIIITSFNLFFALVMEIASMIMENQSALTGSFVAAYIAYLTFSGLMCNTSCSNLSTTKGSIIFQIVSALFSLSWLGYSAFSLSKQFNIFTCQDTDEQTFSLGFFHAIFAASACYLPMVITNWGEAPAGTTSWSVNSSQTSMWAVLAVSWGTILLYGWSFIAPKVCPDRDFD